MGLFDRLRGSDGPRVAFVGIDRERFENASEGELSGLSAPERVLGFLSVNADRAFEAREIAARTDLELGTVSTALSRLKERGVVEHKATYWAVTDNADRLEEYSGYERATALFNEQLGGGDKGAWREHAPSETQPPAENDQ